MSEARLLLVGTSHRHAPVELRERLAAAPDDQQALVTRLAADGREVVVLSTCNRVCVYVAAPALGEARERVVGELALSAGLPSHELQAALYVKEDEDAARHLFRVAAGLDSLVPGESQILGQVRAAYETASRARCVGPVLDRLFRQALQVGRRVRRETGIAENPASVSSAAAELAARVFDDLASRAVLLIGAGKMGELAARNLVSRGVTQLCVVNRSAGRGGDLAEQVGARAVGLGDLPAELERADIVISSTGSQELVVTAETVARAQRRRRGRPLFFVDIAVPRDLDPAINELDGCYLYDVDDLERVVAESLEVRRDAAVGAEALVAEAAAAFRSWQLSRDVAPAIADLRRRAEDIRRAELARVRARLEGLSPGERLAVESLTAQIVNKLLHVPTVRLKESAATPHGAAYAEAVRELFDLRDDAR